MIHVTRADARLYKPSRDQFIPYMEIRLVLRNARTVALVSFISLCQCYAARCSCFESGLGLLAMEIIITCKLLV